MQNKSNSCNPVKKKRLQNSLNIEEKPFPLVILRIFINRKIIIFPIKEHSKSIKQLLQPICQKIINKKQRRNIISWKTTQKKLVIDYLIHHSNHLEILKGQIIDIEPLFQQSVSIYPILKNYQIIKCIGCGGFSRVYLCRLINQGDFKVLKLMDKKKLLENNQTNMIKSEKQILCVLNHPFILQLSQAFETKNFLALSFQYYPGGQLFHLLRTIKRMEQDQARFYFLQVLLAIQYLHQKGIIYRDIKPENIMLDSEGHTKLIDFGLAKNNLKKNQKSYSLCGSPEYMSPEMLAQQKTLIRTGHSFELDYYCLGALLYELVTGIPPFYSLERQTIFQRIKKEEISFSPYISYSEQIKTLITKLLEKNPNKRLGSMAGTRQIYAHPWVRKLKREKVMSKQVQPPFKPNLLTFNIDEQDIQKDSKNYFQNLLNQKEQLKPSQKLLENFRYKKNNQKMKIIEKLRKKQMGSTSKSYLKKSSSIEHVQNKRFKKHQLSKNRNLSSPHNKKVRIKFNMSHNKY